MGLSENSVPLHPMVLLIIIPTFYGYFIGGIPWYTPFSDIPNMKAKRCVSFVGSAPAGSRTWMVCCSLQRWFDVAGLCLADVRGPNAIIQAMC